jgi:hypothetical protein
MRMLNHKLGLIALAGALGIGCAGSLESSRPLDSELGAASVRDDARCRSLDRTRRDWAAVAAVFGAAAGGEGLATLPAESKEAELALAIGAVSSAALAAGALQVSHGASQSWARECSR